MSTIEENRSNNNNDNNINHNLSVEEKIKLIIDQKDRYSEEEFREFLLAIKNTRKPRGKGVPNILDRQAKANAYGRRYYKLNSEHIKKQKRSAYYTRREREEQEAGETDYKIHLRIVRRNMRDIMKRIDNDKMTDEVTAELYKEYNTLKSRVDELKVLIKHSKQAKQQDKQIG